MKFLIRKLIFIGILAALIAAPFAYTEFRSATTTDPFILIAREVEAYGQGVDVLSVTEHKSIDDTVVVVTFIPDYSSWSIHQDHANFNGAVLRIIARHGYIGTVIVIGWDFPPPEYRVQGAYVCLELRRVSCVWEKIASVEMLPEFTVWPGIGEP